MKEKTFVLTVSQYFPQTHPRKGEVTGFIPAIHSGHKIHTIRANFEHWADRVEEINEGRAALSVRVWNGKPYRSKQREVLKYYGLGIERLEFHPGKSFSPYVTNGENYVDVSTFELARNDGLERKDFLDWFRGYDLSKPMAIIHFTHFRYFH